MTYRGLPQEIGNALSDICRAIIGITGCRSVKVVAMCFVVPAAIAALADQQQYQRVEADIVKHRRIHGVRFVKASFSMASFSE